MARSTDWLIVISKIAFFITACLTSAGYAGILVLMAFESACVPLPSEVIMPFAGYLVSTGRLNLYMAATIGALGCNLGSWPTYELARRGGRAAVERFGRWVLLEPRDVDRASHFFKKYGAAAVFVGRLLPGIRSFVAVPAGIAHMPRGRFHLLTFLGSWPWCFTLAWAGMKLGQRWNTDPQFVSIFRRFQDGVFIVSVILVVLFVIHRVRERNVGPNARIATTTPTKLSKRPENNSLMNASEAVSSSNVDPDDG